MPEEFISNSEAVSPSTPLQSLSGIVPMAFSVMMNLPGMKTVYSTPGFYVAPYAVGGDPAAWGGAVIYKTNDCGDTWIDIGIVPAQTLVATINSAPGTGPTTRWDRGNSLTITPLNQETDLLTSVSELSALGGSNTAAIGSPAGEWEVISYTDVVDNGDKTYTLSGLLRGRRGTEYAMSATKDLFVLLKSKRVAFIPIDFADLNVSKEYKVVSIGKSTISGLTISHTNEGNVIKPWSPVHIKGARNASDDLIITWFRRSRAESSWSYMDTTLYDLESYEVDIMDGSTVVRTLSVSGSNSDQTGVTYTASQQIIDFGSVQSSVDVKIYQISDIVGRGFPGEATL